MVPTLASGVPPSTSRTNILLGEPVNLRRAVDRNRTCVSCLEGKCPAIRPLRHVVKNGGIRTHEASPTTLGSLSKLAWKAGSQRTPGPLPALGHSATFFTDMRIRAIRSRFVGLRRLPWESIQDGSSRHAFPQHTRTLGEIRTLNHLILNQAPLPLGYESLKKW